jgi:hypothetical protein
MNGELNKAASLTLQAACVGSAAVAKTIDKANPRIDFVTLQHC